MQGVRSRFGVTYVISTTEFDDGSTAAPLPDDASGTPFPLDKGSLLWATCPSTASSPSPSRPGSTTPIWARRAA